jgi:peptidoglycan hydrolase CwlO-like protein
MGRPAHKTLVWAVGVVIGIIFIAGCQEEQTPPDTPSDTPSDTPLNTKRSRLIAVQNTELKIEIERIKREHQKELKKQEQVLGKCQESKRELEKLSTKGFKNYMDDVLGPAVDENKTLREENERLKEQVGQLEAQIQRLKKELDERGEKPGLPNITS